MGLFINSQLQSLNIHKRLTELEKLSEISTGILALKSMVEGGDKLSNRQAALENLSRILPMLSATQQKYVVDEIFTPLLNDASDPSLGEFSTKEFDPEYEQELEGASSDYEMEFQLKLNKAKFDVKELNREQLEFRREQEKERIKEEQAKLSAERKAKALEKVGLKIEKSWTELQQSSKDNPLHLKRQLTSFIFRYSSGIGRNHQRILEAKRQLEVL